MLKRIGLLAVAAMLLSGSVAVAQVMIEGEEGGDEFGSEESKPVRMPLRSFERFSLESATPTGFWAEVGSFYLEFNDDDADSEADLISALARFAYGQKNWEAGAQIPYLWEEVDSPGPSFDEDGVGDLEVWGKFIPLRGPMMDLGGGLQLSLPTGDDDDFGSGEVEVLPFLTSAFHIGILDVRGHVGLNILTEGDTDADSLVYGFGAFLPILDYVGLRAEFVTFRVDDNDHPVTSFVPGVDFRIPAGPVDILVRPTGAVGVSELAPDFGFGGSIAVAQAPQEELPPAPPPPPPPPVAAPAPVEPPAKKKLVLRGVQFDFDKADIRPDAKPVLDAAVETLNEHGTVAIVAEGHTDSAGTEEYNEKLSQRRAASVRSYLVSRGIAASRIKVEGLGESKPVASNDTEDGMAQNRRVELQVVSE